MQANMILLTVLFLATAMPVFACGQCGTFTTMAFLWVVTFPAIFYIALVAVEQYQLLKEPMVRKLIACGFIFLFVYPYMSYDLAWMLLLSICLFQIGRQAQILARHSDEGKSVRRKRRAIIALYGVFPLFVVAGIVIAAATNSGIIFYPRYSDAQVRSKTVRLKADLRNVTHALETYYADNTTFPQPGAEFVLPAVLTTPVAYYNGNLPGDGLLPGKPSLTYFLSDDGKLAAIISKGPDWKLQILPGRVLWDKLQIGAFSYMYDPTNGTLSAGDIYQIVGVPEKQ